MNLVTGEPVDRRPMQIDRTSFLLLATAIAASCAPAAGPAPTTAAAGTTTAPSTSATAPPAATTAGSADKGYWPTHPVSEGGMGPGPVNEGGYWPGPSGGPTSEGGYTPPTTTKPPPPFNSAACSGDASGTPGSCSALKFDKSCAPFPFVNDACNDAIKYYKPKIAERAVACIGKQSPKKLCDAMNTYNCKDSALRSACADSGADAQCLQILGACKGTSMSECRGYLSGMNDVGRAAMVKCMTAKSGCSYGLYSCTESL